MGANDQSHNGVKRKQPSQDTPQVKKQKLLAARQKLPIWSRKADIQKALKSNDVLILSGEPGSGKSTQVPQFLAAQTKGKIAVTQPRRVAAITLARRVAEEMGTPCGSSSPSSQVGYSVRFDESTSPSTRIKYLTEGMLLQEMLKDASLSQYGCVVVDEVHERSVNVDLILGFLKQLLDDPKRRKTPLRVVVMSATADMDSISRFFSGEQCFNVPHDGAHGPGEPTTDAGPESEAGSMGNGGSDANLQAIKRPTRQCSVATCHVEGRQYPVKLTYLDAPTDNVIDSCLYRIFQIHCKEPVPGDILVFLTGQETIQTLQTLIEESASDLGKEFPKLVVLPLFAALPQSAQQRVFEPLPGLTRKVILSTNIAETSVTVPGVRFVIDTGKAKIKQFRSRLGLDSLLVRPISRSSADQRKGRAGREAPGQCFRLFTPEGYAALDQAMTPEIVRCDLAEAILKMKARGVADVLRFPFLTPPPAPALEKALVHLLALGALAPTGHISPLGRRMASLPLPPSLGRVVLAAAAASSAHVLLPVLDIVASLSVENIFLPVDSAAATAAADDADAPDDPALRARHALFRRQGDHLTLLAAVQGYAAEPADRRRWAAAHLVSHRAMRAVMDVRKQLRAQCRAAGLLGASSAADADADAAPPSDADAALILRCFATGFLFQTARLCGDGAYRTLVGQVAVAIHPGSALFGQRRKPEAIVCHEVVFTNRAWARGVSAVEVGWLEEVVAGVGTGAGG